MNERDRFYLERDRRTREFVDSDALFERQVVVCIGGDAARSKNGQVAVLALVNMLARVHRDLVFVVPHEPLFAMSIVPANDLRGAIISTARAIDPFIRLSFAERPPPDAVAIGLGAEVPSDIAWFAGAGGSVAQIARSPVPIEEGGASILGAAFAACLAASTLFRMVCGHGAVPCVVSCWDASEDANATRGPNTLGPLDVGDVAMVGAGAVGSAVTYWLAQIGVAGKWDVIDADLAKLHNTNRCLNLLASDAGWPSGPVAHKAHKTAQLIGAEPFVGWYDDWASRTRARPDLVLPLANEHHVRHIVGARGEPIVLHATTSSSWQAQFHRHIPHRDDCIDCRMRDVPTPSFGCSSAPLPGPPEKSPDAALPFLSAAAGLLLVASLYRLQFGDLLTDTANHWAVDFLSRHRFAQRNSWRCREDCVQALPEEVLRHLNNGRRWDLGR
jgi:hypothetical protein